jgi:hypothetical protein
MNNNSTFESQLRIDLFHLEVELEGSAALCFEASKAVDTHQDSVREAELEVVAAEEDIKLAKARACQEYAEQCETSGGKYTDGRAETFYRQHPDHVQAKSQWLRSQTALLEKRKKLDRARSVMFATHKRDANIKDLVRLYLGNYFHGPAAPHDLEKMKAQCFRPSAIMGEAIDREIHGFLNEVAEVPTPVQEVPAAAPAPEPLPLMAPPRRRAL